MGACMPESFTDTVNRVLRDHEGYTGDGVGGDGLLPIGDRSTSRKPIVKRDMREALLSFGQIAESAVGVFNGFEDTFNVTSPAGQDTFNLRIDPLNKILCEVFITKNGRTVRLTQDEFELSGTVLTTEAIYPPASVSVQYRIPAQANSVTASLVTTDSGLSAQDELERRVVSFASRAELAAWVAAGNVPIDGREYRAWGLSYLGSTGATDIADLPGLVPNGVGVSPGHFGGVVGIGSDQAAAVQAAADFVKASWNAANWSFDRVLDFHGEVYRADSSIDFSGLRQPRMKARNGQLYSRATGKIAFDMALSNGAILDNFRVYGAQDAQPAWGIYYGRALYNGGYPGVDGVSLIGESGAWGYFSRGSILSFAAEVSSWSDTVVCQNKNRSITSVAFACVDNMQTIATQFGTETTSDFQTLPTAATGNHSNVCHNFGPADIRRVSDVNLTITGITKANPAVVTVSAGTLAGAALSNGDKIFISAGDMTQVAYKVFTVANINTGADTFELSGVNSTAYTTYTSGATVQNQTGPAMLSAGMRTVSIEGGYLLSYGSPSIVTDLNNGGGPYDWNLLVQTERHNDKPFTFNLTSGTVVLPMITIRSTNTSQTAETAIMFINGGGTIRLDKGQLAISNMASAPSGSVLSPQAQFNARDFDISVPLAAALPTVSSMAGYSGRMTAQDRNPVTTLHGFGLRGTGNVEFATSSTALTTGGLRWANDRLYAYRTSAGAERTVYVQDTVTTPNLNDITHAVNTRDKWQGKMAFNLSTNKPVYATGGAASSTWVDATGAVTHTPV